MNGRGESGRQSDGPGGGMLVCRACKALQATEGILDFILNENGIEILSISLTPDKI